MGVHASAPSHHNLTFSQVTTHNCIFSVVQRFTSALSQIVKLLPDILTPSLHSSFSCRTQPGSTKQKWRNSLETHKCSTHHWQEWSIVRPYKQFYIVSTQSIEIACIFIINRDHNFSETDFAKMILLALSSCKNEKKELSLHVMMPI